MFTQSIRRQFLEFFKSKQHALVPSSSVIPHDDPTLLFVNAGMNQFKDLFLGKGRRDYTRAVTSQKCIRVGGKHNDLENVGHTNRHLTFFEMLGNFSFGDYFKEEAISFAWEVSTQLFGFDPERIWPSVFLEDDQAFEIWTQFVPAERITRFGEKDNFWAMGETGPCGPCSELYYDKGPAFGEGRNPSEDPTGERYLEFWNLVFMQYNRLPSGHKEPLPRPSIDTGAGLERVVSLKMGVESLFETDVLRSLIAQIEDISGLPYQPASSKAAAFRVIADHLRSLSFAIADGAQPSNVERGYVLRKLLRRAVRYGRQLGMEKPFLAELLPQLLAAMGEDYPELVKGQARIAEILNSEEEAFLRTLKRGGNLLGQIVQKAEQGSKIISGDDAFKLKDTYGLPLEEIRLLAKDARLQVDEPRYQKLEEEAKERSRSLQKNVQQLAEENQFSQFVEQTGESLFTGYADPHGEGITTGLLDGQDFTTSLQSGQEGAVILNATSFYPEMGGQVGDSGFLLGQGVRFEVSATSSPYKGVILHRGKVVEGTLKIGTPLQTQVDVKRRQKIARNHTATHLLHWALQHVLGEHIKQAGSLVDAGRLRFDFNHHKPLSREEIRQIETLVNEKIRDNRPVLSYELAYEEAQKRKGIKQFFGEKYGATVRVIDIDSYSQELCGGTHTSAVGTIGLFRICKESSIAAGIRRIEAVTGQEAEDFSQHYEDIVEKSAALLKTSGTQLHEKLEKVLEENKQLAHELKELKKKELRILVRDLKIEPGSVQFPPFVAAALPISPDELRLCMDLLLERLPSGIAVVGAAAPGRCSVIAHVSPEWAEKGWSAHALVQSVAPLIGGSGGGKVQTAQAGGKAPEGLDQAINLIREKLANRSS